MLLQKITPSWMSIISFSLSRYWEGADVCIMLEDIDFVCEILRILMEACTDNGN